MNEKTRARIIGDCIDMVQTSQMSRSDCTRKYPNLADELNSAFFSMDAISSIAFSKIDPLYQRKWKIRLTQKLPDRENIVTKRVDHRYRLQNLKRRFVMTWVVIVTTILSLISGAGAVYASSDALPGDTLYPVKTWVEDVQLAIAPEDVDAGLLIRFAEHRVEEAVELVHEGRFEDLDKAADGYQKHTELLTQTMARVEGENPDEAIKFRLELEEKLQEQARLMEASVEDGEETNHLHVQIQEMLETNNKLSLRINEDEEAPEIEMEGLDETGVVSSTASDAGEMKSEETSGQKGNGNSSFEINEEGTLTVGLGSKGGNGVYAEIDSVRFDCAVDGDTAACNINGAPEKGNVNIYDKKTNQLLYSYAYEYAYAYAWEGEKSESGNDVGKNENENSGKDSNSHSKDK